RYRCLHFPVEDANATGLYDQVVSRACIEGIREAGFRCWIDYYSRPWRIFDVTVLLPLVRIGFIERDLMSPRRQRTYDAAVVCGCSVPIRRHQTRPEKRDPHDQCAPCISASSGMFRASTSSSPARCAQV